MYKLPTAIMIN